jgi:hypothetical protein
MRFGTYAHGSRSRGECKSRICTTLHLFEPPAPSPQVVSDRMSERNSPTGGEWLAGSGAVGSCYWRFQVVKDRVLGRGCARRAYQLDAPRLRFIHLYTIHSKGFISFPGSCLGTHFPEAPPRCPTPTSPTRQRIASAFAPQKHVLSQSESRHKPDAPARDRHRPGKTAFPSLASGL